MTPEQSAAYINAQTACALAEIEAMKAANRDAELKGDVPRFGWGDFINIPDRYGIHHNAVVSSFQE